MFGGWSNITLAAARGLSIDFRAYVISLHARCQSEHRIPPVPIRTPEWSSRKAAKGKFNSHSHFARLNTNATFYYRSKGCTFSLIHYLYSIIQLWSSCHADFRGSRHGWGLLLEHTYTQHLQGKVAQRCSEMTLG